MVNEELNPIRWAAFSRQADLVSAYDASKLKTVVIGCGGLGSNVVHIMVSMGFQHFEVYDPDVVSYENVAPQFVGGTIDRSKADSLKLIIDRLYAPLEPQIIPHNEPYVDQEVEADLVILAVDSIPLRKQIWENHRIHGWKWWLDGRMGGSQFQLFTFPNGNQEAVEEYEDWLKIKEVKLACGMKATAFITKGFAPGLFGANLRNIVAGKKVPFLNIYGADTYELFTENRWYSYEQLPTPA